MRYKWWRMDPEKYILDDELDDDVRENVINYNEEGAGRPLYINKSHTRHSYAQKCSIFNVRMYYF